MMDFANLQRLVEAMRRFNFECLEYETKTLRLRLVLDDTETAGGPLVEVRTGAMGHFRLSHPRIAQPAARVGQMLEKGEILAWLEYGQVLVGIPAPVSGKLESVEVQNGDLVGFGMQVATILQKEPSLQKGAG